MNPGGRHHPANFADQAVHGPAAKAQTEDCTQCHGANLDGQGSQVDPSSLQLAPQGCNTHHNQYNPGAAADAWRTDCTFCHGDRSGSYDASMSGAPPRGIGEVGCTPSGSGCTPVPQSAATAEALTTFKKHQIHITGSSTHVAYDCAVCHPSKPADALSPGHWIVGDDTPGIVEVSATLGGVNGVPAGGSYAGTGTGTCNNVYCHGNGVTGGTVSDTQTSSGCNFCHSHLTGRHGDHTGASCYDCHGVTVNASDQIADATKHIDGQQEFLLTVSGATLTFSNGHCSGSCHMGNETRTHSDNW